MQAVDERDEDMHVDGKDHVHFSAEQVAMHNSEIVIRPEGDDKLGVHLGFLQFHHHYQVAFTIKDDLGEDVVVDPLQNLFCKVYEIQPSEDGQGHDVVLDLSAHKEKLMKEEIIIESARSPGHRIKLVIHARVLGKGKGTPSLRSGIHCTGIDPEDESDHSDWQGFD